MAIPAHHFAETIVSVQGVSKKLGGVPILRDLSLEIKDVVRPDVEQGQVVALLAPSGMGKTTLFKILAGLEEPDEGTILLEKEAIPVKRGMVGVVAQNYPLFEHRTVLGNLAVAGRQAGLNSTEAKAKAGQLLEDFGLAEHGKKYPVQLSGGQRQRIAIAQQFMCSDHFLLMDEPFSGLDLLALDRLCQFIGAVAQTDTLKTFIIVTHDVNAAVEVADTIWLMGRDRDADGKPIPGARIQKVYNLIERDLAWRHGVTTTPQFMDLVNEIRAAFPSL